MQALNFDAQARFEHFRHEADIGVRGFGATLDQAFSQAARALIAVITDIDLVESSVSVKVQCQAPDKELLLVDWLNAVVYEMATRHLLFHDFDVQIFDHTLQATMSGEPVIVAKHHPAVEVKGATYTGLKVEQLPGGGWCAQCVVDV